MGGEWNPWRALREREHIDFRLAALPYDLRGVYWPRGERTAIVLSPVLSRAERNAALAHELVHDERGGGCEHAGMPESWDAMVSREELRVSRIVASRLVPLSRLRHFVATLVDLDEPVTVSAVADEFDTTDAVAATALRILELNP